MHRTDGFLGVKKRKKYLFDRTDPHEITIFVAAILSCLSLDDYIFRLSIGYRKAELPGGPCIIYYVYTKLMLFGIRPYIGDPIFFVRGRQKVTLGPKNSQDAMTIYTYQSRL